MVDHLTPRETRVECCGIDTEVLFVVLSDHSVECGIDKNKREWLDIFHHSVR